MLTGKGVTGDRLNYEVGFTEGYASVLSLNCGDGALSDRKFFRKIFFVKFREFVKVIFPAPVPSEPCRHYR